MRLRNFVVVIVFFLSGCQTMMYGTATDFEKISVGMTKTQVIEILGSPLSVSADGDKSEEYLIYKRMKGVISMWPRMYEVTLRNGKVVKYGEQYKTKNINLN